MDKRDKMDKMNKKIMFLIAGMVLISFMLIGLGSACSTSDLVGLANEAACLDHCHDCQLTGDCGSTCLYPGHVNDGHYQWYQGFFGYICKCNYFCGDEGMTPQIYYIDYDGDGYTSQTANEAKVRDYCMFELPGIGTTPKPAGDCDDDNIAIHPGATEICGNGIDDDCVGGDASCCTIGSWYDTGDYSCTLYPGEVYQRTIKQVRDICPSGQDERWIGAPCPDGNLCELDSGDCCTPDESCAATTCFDSLCDDAGCEGRQIPGELMPDCPTASDVACGELITSSNECNGCSGEGTMCASNQVCNSGVCEYSSSEENQSFILPDVNRSVVINMFIEYFNSTTGTWEFDSSVVDDSAQSLVQGVKFKLDELLWNVVGFNASDLNNGFGTYRAVIEVSDDYGILGDAYYQFEVRALASDIVVDNPDPVLYNDEVTDIDVDFNGVNYPLEISFELEDSEGVIVNTQPPITVNGEDDLPVTYATPSGLDEGAYSLYMIVEDSEGHRDRYLVTTITIIVDVLGPVIEIIYPEDGDYNIGSILFEVSSNEVLDNCFVNFNDTDYVLSVNVDGMGALISVDGIIDGSYTALFECMDLAGNSVVENVDFNIDTVAPIIVDFEVLNELAISFGDIIVGENLTIIVNISGEADNVWVVVWSEENSNSSIVVQENFVDNGDGTWIVVIQTNVNFPIGEVNFTVYANDNAGNQVSADSSFNLVPNILGCSNLDVENGVYDLEEDIVDVVETCFIISADNITLNGNGFSIDGDDVDNDYGILIQADDASVIGFGGITDFETGIGIENSDNANVEGNAVNSNQNGIMLIGGSENNLLTNNDLFSNGNYELADRSNIGLRNYLVYSNTEGEILWTNIGFLSNLTTEGDLVLGTSLIIGDNYIEIDETELSDGINSQATLTLRNLNVINKTDFRILRNGIECNGLSVPSCVNLTALDSVNVLIDISGFSNYSIGSTDIPLPSPPEPPVAPSSSGSGGGRGSGKSPCITYWQCGDWSKCIDGIMKRDCFNRFDYCRNEIGAPPDMKTCVSDVVILPRQEEPAQVIEPEEPGIIVEEGKFPLWAKILIGVLIILLFLIVFVVLIRRHMEKQADEANKDIAEKEVSIKGIDNTKVINKK